MLCGDARANNLLVKTLWNEYSRGICLGITCTYYFQVLNRDDVVCLFPLRPQIPFTLILVVSALMHMTASVLRRVRASVEYDLTMAAIGSESIQSNHRNRPWDQCLIRGYATRPFTVDYNCPESPVRAVRTIEPFGQTLGKRR